MIPVVYCQQKMMYDNDAHTRENRIVSLEQPADRIYQTRRNKMFCTQLGIQLPGPPSGRRKASETDTKIRRQIYQDACERNVVEGRNGIAKRRSGLDRLFSKLDETAKTEAALIILAMIASLRLVHWLALFFRSVLSFSRDVSQTP